MASVLRILFAALLTVTLPAIAPAQQSGVEETPQTAPEAEARPVIRSLSRSDALRSNDLRRPSTGGSTFDSYRSPKLASEVRIGFGAVCPKPHRLVAFTVSQSSRS